MKRMTLLIAAFLMVMGSAQARDCKIGESKLSMADYGLETYEQQQDYLENTDSGAFALMMIQEIVRNDPFSQEGGELLMDISSRKPVIVGDFSAEGESMPLDGAVCSMPMSSGISLICEIKDEILVQINIPRFSDRGSILYKRDAAKDSVLAHNEIICE
jgi:hypothetical protein